MQYNNRGFTLIEILVVMGIFVLIAGYGLFVSMDSYRAFSFRGDRDTAVTVLQKARSQAMSNICLGSACTDGKPHGVHFTAAQYIIFQGANLDDTPQDAAVDQAIPINGNVSFTPSAPSDIIFNQLDGGSTAYTFTIKDSAGHSSDITVNSEGQIIWTK